MLEDATIAIPSHNRPEVLASKTLKLLKEAGNKWPIHVFLSSIDQLAAYKKVCTGVTAWVCGPYPGLVDKVNAIHQHYAYGSPVLVMEDDITEIVTKVGNAVVGANSHFNYMVEQGFTHCVKSGGAMWGINPTANGFYMDYKPSTTLKLIVAYLYGFISTPHKGMLVTLPCKMDYERTLLHHRMYGSSPRLNNYAVKTAPYVTAGGLQDMGNRLEMENASVASLIFRFPHNVRRNTKRNGPYPEILLRK